MTKKIEEPELLTERLNCVVTATMKRDVLEIADAVAGLNQGDIVRQAVEIALPELRKRYGLRAPRQRRSPGGDAPGETSASRERLEEDLPA